MTIRLAEKSDITAWICLVDKLKENFPGLETQKALEEHRNIVLGFIERKEAICAFKNEEIAGLLLFSREKSSLCFLAVDTKCRREHIAKKMFDYMLTFMGDKKEIFVTTYREGVPAGVAARAFYKGLGFKEGKLGEEFGCPVQEFVLKI